MKTLPKSVEIFGNVYSVELLSGDSAELKNEFEGRVLYTSRKIYVSKDIPTTAQQEVFVHEVIHGLLYTSGLASVMDSKVVEGVCDCIGCGLRGLVFGG